MVTTSKPEATVTEDTWRYRYTEERYLQCRKRSRVEQSVYLAWELQYLYRMMERIAYAQG
jgi:hypothetical protein